MSDSVCKTCKHYMEYATISEIEMECLLHTNVYMDDHHIISKCNQHQPRQAQWDNAYREPCEDQLVDAYEKPGKNQAW